MAEYKEILKEYYETSIGFQEAGETKLTFICESVFGIFTYDGGIGEVLGQKMLDVCKVILERKTFDYQKESDQNYLNYLTMCNMPFLVNKLEWGTSIRGAWFDDFERKGEKPYLLKYLDLLVPKPEIKKFITELIEWAEE